MPENLFYLGFAIFPGIGPALFTKLHNKFGSANSAWNASEKDLLDVLPEKLVSEFVTFRKKFDLQNYAKELDEKHIGYVTLVDEDYPSLLRSISASIGHPGEATTSIGSMTDSIASLQNDNLKLKKHSPPFVLFYKGDRSLFENKKTIGIVGTRTMSQYGKEVTSMLTRDLVHEGFVVVSGLALGVDGVAHETCLENNGKTIAVLGSGVDICTPSNHQKLYERILEQQGLIVSTVPPGEEPNKGSFPARNKIIAGLSLGVILTEGASDSGALYTADFAKDMGRPVFAVPGPITSRLSAATTTLLKNGATLVSATKDVVDRLGIMTTGIRQQARGNNKKGDTPEEQEILDLLENEPLHFNEIVRKIGKDSKKLGSLLSLMELKGMVKSIGEIYNLV